jgi:cytochrome c-type biogenesis protein CcmH/NrfF
MIIRETRVLEAWCPVCGAGQMEQILQTGFDEQIDVNKTIGRTFKCKNCQSENIVDDYISLIPQSFLIFSKNELTKAKQNDDIKKFYDAE